MILKEKNLTPGGGLRFYCLFLNQKHWIEEVSKQKGNLEFLGLSYLTKKKFKKSRFFQFRERSELKRQEGKYYLIDYVKKRENIDIKKSEIKNKKTKKKKK